MQSRKYTIKLTLKSHKSKQVIIDILNTFRRFNILEQDDTYKPDLLFFELGENFEKEIALIESLLEAGDVGEVFLTSEHAETTVLMRAIKLGVKGFFSQPPKR